MLSAIVLSVIMLSVVAPIKHDIAYKSLNDIDLLMFLYNAVIS
jgi:hypothetical protein